MYETITLTGALFITSIFVVLALSGLALRPAKRSKPFNLLTYLCATTALVASSLTATYMFGKIMTGPTDGYISYTSIAIAFIALTSMYLIFSHEIQVATEPVDGGSLEKIR